VLRNLFRKKDLAELTGEADELFGELRFGDAKLAYDRAAERALKDKHASHAALEARASECCDRLALKRAHEAEELHANGQDELAREELRHALDTARSAAVQEQVREVERRLEGKEAVAEAQEAAPLSDEEHLMLITSSWEPLQAAELEATESRCSRRRSPSSAAMERRPHEVCWRCSRARPRRATCGSSWAGRSWRGRPCLARARKNHALRRTLRPHRSRRSRRAEPRAWPRPSRHCARSSPASGPRREAPPVCSPIASSHASPTSATTARAPSPSWRRPPKP